MQAKTVEEIALLLGASVKGDGKKIIAGVSTIDLAGPQDISFLANDKYAKLLPVSKAGAVVLSEKHTADCPEGTVALISENPRLAFARLLQAVEKKPERKPGVHPSAYVSASAVVDPSAHVGPFCVIGDDTHIGADVVLESHCVISDRCRIGQGTWFYPRVTVYSDVHLGAACTIHSGVVLGSDGFGFAQSPKGEWEKMPQVGGVRIGDKVDIGANTTVDRGALSHTIIGDGVLIDNLVQIAHNVDIGDMTAIAACTGISGSTKIGKRCLIGGSSMIAGHLTIADGVCLTGATGVANDIKEKGVYGSAISARPYEQWRRNLARFHRLDELAKRVKRLEKQLNDR